MSKTIHVVRPAMFPACCVRCISDQFSIRKFTDSASGGVVTVTASTEIPVCDKCWKASKPRWIGSAVCFFIFIAAVIPVAIVQDNNTHVPKVFVISSLLGFGASIACGFVASRKSPVRLVPNKIDRQNVRIKFFNDVYAEKFLEMNRERARVVNPWKYE